ncbi:Protein argonaute-1 [Trichinella pseudospiralis]|uniref:Protein argonaute-1 n=1 Tax=Trichinella pseudospiralis TaxID=6337 RepID=A0A0V0YAR1_TRIPS|nr:Protein argonaute-1 [Trichinella pseudospiralis]
MLVFSGLLAFIHVPVAVLNVGRAIKRSLCPRRAEEKAQFTGMSFCSLYSLCTNCTVENNSHFNIKEGYGREARRNEVAWVLHFVLVVVLVVVASVVWMRRISSSVVEKSMQTVKTAVLVLKRNQTGLMGRYGCHYHKKLFSKIEICRAMERGRKGRDNRRSGQPKTGELRSDDQRSGQPRSGEPRSHERSSGEHRSGQQRSGEQRSGQPRSDQKRSGEPRSRERSSGEHRSSQQRSDEQRSGQPRSDERRSGQPRSGEQRSGQPRSGEPRSHERSSGEHRSGQQRSGQPRSDERRSGQSWSGEPRSHERSSCQSWSGEPRSHDRSSGQSWSGEPRSHDRSSGQSWSGEPRSHERSSCQSWSGEPRSHDRSSGQSWSGEPRSHDRSSGQSWSGEPGSRDRSSGQPKRVQYQTPKQHAPVQGMQQTEEKSCGETLSEEEKIKAMGTLFHLGNLPERCGIDYAKRNSSGQSGNEIELYTNFFSIKIPPDLTFFHYNVEILLTVNRGNGTEDVNITAATRMFSPVDCRRFCIKIYKMLFGKDEIKKMWNYSHMFYDQRANLFSLKNLQITDSVEYTVVTPKGRAKITIKPCNPLLIHIQDVVYALIHIGSDSERSALQALDIATSMKLYDMEVTAIGNKFFKPVADKLNIGGGVELFDGLFKSIRPMLAAACGECYLAFNIESVKAAFFASQPLLQSMMEELRLNNIPVKPLDERQIAQLNKKFSGIRVRTTHLNRSVKMQCFSDKVPMSHVFTDDNGVETTVLEYFKERYGISLRYPNLQMVKRGHTFIPPELCNVEPNQRVPMMRLDDENHRMIVQTCAVPPIQRYHEILAKSAAIGGDDHDLFADAMGLKKSLNMLRVKGRVLPAPLVQYHSDSRNSGKVEPRNGQWDMKHNKVFVAAEISHWALCNMCPNLQHAEIVQFVELLVRKAAHMGIKMNPKPSSYDCIHPRESLERMKTYFDYLIRQKDATYAICVIPEKNEMLRRSIKYYGEVVNGVVTQILLRNTVLKGFQGKKSETLYMQIMLKVNAKNGGVNNEISQSPLFSNMWLNRSMLFMGFDVNHPPALSRRERESAEVPLEPSVVGAVCNCGRTQFDYRIRYRLQDARKEEIEREKVIGVVLEFLKEYQRNNGNTLPKSVIVYRDGVSESQFEMVLQSEKASLQEAFSKFRRGYSPKLTIVIVQKRHHTRFFKTHINPRDNNLNQNIPAGTVVDTGPVSCRLFDFYLCSHLGIQGTSRPTLYTVLYDENDFNADEMQGVTYLLCQTYQRCNKSVSMPAPVYHAHHAATRGKELYCAYRNKIMEETDAELTTDFVQLEKAINSKPVIQQKMTWA